jgi:CDP-paratose 2-epimerase
MQQPEHILITGGAGFAGSRLALGLRERCPGTRVTAFDNLRRRGSEFNLNRLREGGVAFAHGDVRRIEDLEAAGRFDLMIECSAEPSVLAGYGVSPEYVVHTNLTGAVNCMELCRRHDAGMIFLSTSRVYPIAAIRNLAYRETETRFELEAHQNVPGVSPDGFSEDFPLDGIRSLYGATKLSAELLLQEFGAMYGLPYIINRCGVLTGPWQMGKADQGVVVLWVARHIYGGRLNYIGFGGSGKQVRDILHIDDLLDLIRCQIENLNSLNGALFNAGGGRDSSLSLLELTSLCRDITGNAIEIGHEKEDRHADIPCYITDNRRVTAATGWKPQRDTTTIIEEITCWIQDHETLLRPVLS